MSSDDRFDMEELNDDALDCVRAERRGAARGDDFSSRMQKDVLARLEQSIASGAKPTFRDSAANHGLLLVVPMLFLLGAGLYGVSRWQASSGQGEGSPSAVMPTVVATLPAPLAASSRESLPPELPTLDIHALPDRSPPESSTSARRARSSTRPLPGNPLPGNPLAEGPRDVAKGAPAPPARPSSTLVDEYAILNRASQLLSRRDFAAASASLDEHARRFPQGQLVEERERLRINLLVESGRVDEARARAREFRRRFPRGFLLPAVEDSLGGSP